MGSGRCPHVRGFGCIMRTITTTFTGPVRAGESFATASPAVEPDRILRLQQLAKCWLVGGVITWPERFYFCPRCFLCLHADVWAKEYHLLWPRWRGVLLVCGSSGQFRRLIHSVVRRDGMLDIVRSLCDLLVPHESRRRRDSSRQGRHGRSSIRQDGQPGQQHGVAQWSRKRVLVCIVPLRIPHEHVFWLRGRDECRSILLASATVAAAPDASAGSAFTAVTHNSASAQCRLREPLRLIV